MEYYAHTRMLMGFIRHVLVRVFGAERVLLRLRKSLTLRYGQLKVRVTIYLLRFL